MAGPATRPAVAAWTAPATMRPTATPNTLIGASRRSSTSRVPERSCTSGISTPWTPAIRIEIAISPGTITDAEAGGDEPEPRQDVAEHQDHQDRLRERREQQERRLARGDSQVAVQQREEGGHSRSPRPVRWM